MNIRVFYVDEYPRSLRGPSVHHHQHSIHRCFSLQRFVCNSQKQLFSFGITFAQQITGFHISNSSFCFYHIFFHYRFLCGLFNFCLRKKHIHTHIHIRIKIVIIKKYACPIAFMMIVITDHKPLAYVMLLL